MSFPKVSIVILNYNGKRSLGGLLDECLEAALNQTYKNVEIVFADNGSNDESVSYVKDNYGKKLKVAVLGKNYGFCLGNNYAVHHVSVDSTYLLFLNPDAVLSKEYVETLVTYMNSNPDVAASQGIQNLMDGQESNLGCLITSNGMGLALELRYLRAINPDKLQPIPVLWVQGSAMLVRRDLFNKIHGFSKELFMYCDELDLCCRFLASGYKIIGVPDVAYLHKSTNPWQNLNSWYFITRNRWLITIRYFPLKFLPQCAGSFVIDFAMTIYRSIRCGKKEWAKHYFGISAYLIKNFKRELIFRYRWYPVQSLIVNYVIPLHFSNIVEDYLNLEQLNLEPKAVKYLAKVALSSN